MLGFTNITDMEQQLTTPGMGLQNQKHRLSTWNGPGLLAGRLPGWLGGRLAWPWLAPWLELKTSTGCGWPGWPWLAGLAGRLAGQPLAGWLWLASLAVIKNPSWTWLAWLALAGLALKAGSS